MFTVLGCHELVTLSRLQGMMYLARDGGGYSGEQAVRNTLRAAECVFYGSEERTEPRSGLGSSVMLFTIFVSRHRPISD